MGTHLRHLILVMSLPLLAFANWQMDFDELWASAGRQPTTLTFAYVDTYPATITIGGSLYGQPADPSKALVDAGDGVFVPWTSNTITLKGNRIRFRGDWRNSNGNFRELFNRTFAGGYDVTISGGFDFEGAPVNAMFWSTFAGCSNLTGPIPSGLFGNISGAPVNAMFFSTFSSCSNLTGPIPSGLFGNISGKPATYMFGNTFNGCSKLTGPIPSGLFGNISGKPATYMFGNTFNGCSGLTGSIPASLFGDISGAPADYMFFGTFSDCSRLTGLPYRTASGDYLWDIYPEATGTQVSGFHGNNTGLDGWPSSVPEAWR